MDIINIVFSDILNHFNFSYIFSIVILTYIIIKFIDYINKDKKVSTWSKRIVLTISIIFITTAYIFSGYKDYITLLNSAIFSPVFYSWLLKPILDKLGVGYKHIDKLKGAHFDEEYAKWQVSTMYHTADNGKICKGEIYNYDCAKNVFDKYVRNINSSITVWDVYVAINAQYHDYIRLYSEWFRNINKNELDNKIIESAITFYFKDEDSGSTKTWNYFKTAN